MTNRDRLLSTLRGGTTDRHPIWLLFPWHPTSYYADVRHSPCYAEVFEASLRCAVHLDRRNFQVTPFTAEVEQETRSWKEGSKDLRSAALRWKGRSLTEEPGRRKLIENEADLEFFCSLPVNDDPAAIHAELETQWPRYLAERAEFPMELGSMMLDLGEPIGLLYHAANLLEYPIWSLTHSGMIEDLLKRLQKQFLAVYRFFLERDAADVYFLVGSELASPPMVSRATFRQWIVPFAAELIALIHSYGKLVIQHYHGQIREILPDFLDMAPDGLHTIEAPPVGNCTLGEAFEMTGNRITLIGNIQYDDFRSLSVEEMREAMRALITEVAGRRFILSPSAGPYEAEITPSFARNYLAFMKAGWEFGKLKSQD